MVQAERHKFLCFSGNGARLKQLEHMLIHVSAIFANLIQPGTRKSIAQRFFRLLAYRVVIRIKEIAKLRVEGPVSGQMTGKNKGLKKPAGMGHMPLARAGLSTGLQRYSFRRERGGQ